MKRSPRHSDRGELPVPLKLFGLDQEENCEKLGKNDAINDVDDTVAGWDVRGNDVGSAAVRVGKNATTLEEESTVQSADAIRAQHFTRVAVSARDMIKKNLIQESLVSKQVGRCDSGARLSAEFGK